MLIIFMSSEEKKSNSNKKINTELNIYDLCEVRLIFFKLNYSNPPGYPDRAKFFFWKFLNNPDILRIINYKKNKINEFNNHKVWISII